MGSSGQYAFYVRSHFTCFSAEGKLANSVASNLQRLGNRKKI